MTKGNLLAVSMMWWSRWWIELRSVCIALLVVFGIGFVEIVTTAMARYM
jgi:hypothetical protein